MSQRRLITVSPCGPCDSGQRRWENVMVAPVDVLIRERNADRAQFGLRPLPEVVIPTVRVPSVVDRGCADEANDQA